MEAHPRGDYPYNRDPERPQESHILLDVPKPEPLASMLVSLSIQIQFLLIHRPGQHSAKPDALSHQADHQTEEEEDNQD